MTNKEKLYKVQDLKEAMAPTESTEAKKIRDLLKVTNDHEIEKMLLDRLATIEETTGIDPTELEGQLNLMGYELNYIIWKGLSKLVGELTHMVKQEEKKEK